MSRHPDVDAYIAGAAPFARPILEHLRAQVHAVCPDADESLKWRFPHFGYHGLLCSMAAFKQHCAFGFRKHTQIFGDDLAASDAAMGQFGRITSVKELPPPRELQALIRRAMAFNEAGRPVAKTARPPRKPPVATPDDLAAALKKSAAARQVYEAFSPSHRRDYVEWITEAKTATTRERRLAQAVEWMAEGKSRNWKYERPKSTA